VLGSAWECLGVLGSAWECLGVLGSAWECLGWGVDREGGWENAEWGMGSVGFPGSCDGPGPDEESFEFFVLFGRDQALQFSPINEPMFEQFTNELDVFRSACRQFTECEIVLLKAPAYRVG
jgi:hypothetical protein